MSERHFQITNEGCQPHIFEQIVKAIDQWVWLIPPWFRAFRVVFDPGEPGTLSIGVREEYREAHLRVLNGWAKVPPEMQGKWVLHEILHIYTDPLFVAFHDLLEATTEDGSSLNKWGQTIVRCATERATNDLEEAIFGRLPQTPRLRGEI